MTKATNSKPQGHRLEICNAWQPIQAKQGNRGMSCFLSCLYVWTSFGSFIFFLTPRGQPSKESSGIT